MFLDIKRNLFLKPYRKRRLTVKLNIEFKLLSFVKEYRVIQELQTIWWFLYRVDKIGFS